MGSWFDKIKLPVWLRIGKEPTGDSDGVAHGYGRALGNFVRQQSASLAYKGSFEVIHADTSELRDRSFRLRHKVFCEEYGYETPPEPGIYIEYDAYDEKAQHFLLRHRLSHEIAATVRVILPEDDGIENFPAQNLCPYPILESHEPNTRFCEISKFCTAQRFRQREEDGGFLASYSEQDVICHDDGETVRYIRRTIPYMQAGLLRAVFEAALKARVTDCIWLVETAHLKSLKRMGIPYRVLGPVIETHGGIQPLTFNIRETLDAMKKKSPSCWTVVSDGGRLNDMARALEGSSGWSFPVWKRRTTSNNAVYGTPGSD